MTEKEKEQMIERGHNIEYDNMKYANCPNALYYFLLQYREDCGHFCGKISEMSPDELESLAEEAMKFYTVNISSTGTEKPNIQKFTLQKISELVYKFVVSRPSRSTTVYFNMLDETSTELFTIEEIVKIDDQYLCYFGRSQENKQLHKIPLGEYNEVYIENAFKYLLMNNSDFVDFVNSETSKNISAKHS